MSPPRGEVLRGMEVEATPLRVGRMRETRASAVPACVPAPHEDALLRERQEAALREAREQAQKAGFEEGLRLGRAEAAVRGEAQVSQAVIEATSALRSEQRALATLKAALESAVTDCISAAEDELVALCYDTLCRMLGRHAIGVDAVRSQVVTLMAQGAVAPQTAIHLHPQDAQQLLDDPQAAPHGVRWVADPEVTVGGCIVKGPGGGLDARLETMLATCKRALLTARADTEACA